ncbi:DNA polymerase epsilon subunit 3 [Pararge aegeria]|uniref:DNA polymerase epsilon subunit 3 n=2 Tax=Pararge aegeria TaxID=116150 RepID=A0A8S4SLB8_9NEOP|nr:DNA polymerase epsilon subunit 3 [Pararge aegeria]CAH2266956.1 jg12198 [Pararge aegeria aegeria]
MAEKLEDLNLPLTVVTRIVKETLPDGVAISKEARTGLAKAASVFVLYVTSAATNIVKNNKRKALTGQDVLEAMADIEFDRFVEPLREALENYKQAVSAKKMASGKKKDDNDDVEMVEEDL